MRLAEHIEYPDNNGSCIIRRYLTLAKVMLMDLC